MRKGLFLLLALLVLAFVGITLAVAQEAAKPAKAGEKAAAEKAKAGVTKSETLAGTIQMVVTDKKLVVVASSSGTPFNFKVTSATRIKVAGKKAKLTELADQANKSATVKFLALRSGNVAQSIEVSQ